MVQCIDQLLINLLDIIFEAYNVVCSYTQLKGEQNQF